MGQIYLKIINGIINYMKYSKNTACIYGINL